MINRILVILRLKKEIIVLDKFDIEGYDSTIFGIVLAGKIKGQHSEFRWFWEKS